MVFENPKELAMFLHKYLPKLDQQRLRDAISHSSSFGVLSAEIQTELEHVMQLRLIPHGADISRKGDASDCLYLLVNGRFSMLKDDDTVIGELNRGDVFSELGGF